MSVTRESRVVANSDTLARQIEADTVLLSMERTEYFGLNPTGTRIWQLLQDPRSVADICEIMAREYDVDRVVLEADVLAVIDDLIGQGLALVLTPDVR